MKMAVGLSSTLSIFAALFPFLSFYFYAVTDRVTR